MHLTMIICEGEGNVDVLLIRNKSAFLIWSPKISAEVKKSVKTSENQCTPAFKVKQDKWGQGNWALERCKKPNQNNELQQPTGLYGSRRKNSPWPMWCSRAAWDPSPCFPNTRSCLHPLPQAWPASFEMQQEGARLHPRKGQQRRRQQVRCHWVPRECSEAEQLLLLSLGQGSSVQPAALP